MPSHYSAQAAELVALTESCKLIKRQESNYLDRYAFSTVCAAQWKNRGMKTSSGKPVTHAHLLKQLIAIMLPKEVVVCKCAAHTKKSDEVSKGNYFADKTAKEGAQDQIGLMATTEKNNNNLLTIHPSTFLHLSAVRTWGQQSKQGHPGFPLSSHFLQLFWGVPQVFLGQLGDKGFPVWPGSSRGPSPRGM